MLLGSALTSAVVRRRAAVLSDSPAVREVGSRCGAQSCAAAQSDGGAALAGAVLIRLGQPACDGEPPFHLVVLHLFGANTGAQLDELLGRLASQPRANRSIYLALALAGPPAAPPDAAQASLPAHVAALRPVQSYERAADGRVLVPHALVTVHSLYGCVRVDGAQSAHAEEVAQHGARGIIHAADMLAEVAIKLGRALKLGS